MFVALACWFAYHPPAPLALTADHVEHVWAGVQGRFAHLRQDLAGLEASVSGGAHALSARVQHLGEELMHGLEGGLHATRLDAVAHGLQEGLHGLQEGARAALDRHLEQQLGAVVRWPMPRWPVYVYFAGACVCLLTSCVCHLLGCCARHISQVVWRFDYAGIAVLIVASFYPAVYYAFLCQPFWRTFYLATTTLAGAGVVAVSLPERFQATRFRALRACVFSALGLWGVVPVAHQLACFWHVWAIRHAFKLDLLMGFLYLAGAAVYASRVPERWFPGRLDLVGHSHQLWHVAVVLAALVHYRAILVLLQWRDASGGCAAPLQQHVPSALRALEEGGGGGALAIEQLWQSLSAQLHAYVGVAAADPAAAMATAATAPGV